VPEKNSEQFKIRLRKSKIIHKEKFSVLIVFLNRGTSVQMERLLAGIRGIEEREREEAEQRMERTEQRVKKHFFPSLSFSWSHPLSLSLSLSFIFSFCLFLSFFLILHYFIISLSFIFLFFK
jgi:hypothetical protein